MENAFIPSLERVHDALPARLGLCVQLHLAPALVLGPLLVGAAD